MDEGLTVAPGDTLDTLVRELAGRGTGNRWQAHLFPVVSSMQQGSLVDNTGVGGLVMWPSTHSNKVAAKRSQPDVVPFGEIRLPKARMGCVNQPVTKTEVHPDDRKVCF